VLVAEVINQRFPTTPAGNGNLLVVPAAKVFVAQSALLDTDSFTFAGTALAVIINMIALEYFYRYGFTGHFISPSCSLLIGLPATPIKLNINPYVNTFTGT
jgi:hypothetical protein